MTENALANIPVITQAILDAQPLTKHVEQLDYLEGLAFMAQKIGATLETKNDIGDALVRICRNAGQRFIVDFPRGGDGSNQYAKKEQSISKKRLAECGFNDWRANVCRKIAALPEDVFEDLILNIRLGEHRDYTEINMTNFRKAGRIHIARMNGTHYEVANKQASRTPDQLYTREDMLRAYQEACILTTRLINGMLLESKTPIRSVADPRCDFLSDDFNRFMEKYHNE